MKEGTRRPTPPWARPRAALDGAPSPGRRHTHPLWALPLAVAAACHGALAAETAKPPARPPMELGPAVSFIFNNGPTNHPLGAPDDRLVLKGLSIRLGDGAAACFDTEALCYAAGWTGGFLESSKSSIQGSASGSSPVFPAGRKGFSIAPGRRRPAGGHFKGHYLHGARTVLSYSLGGADILDLPGAEGPADAPVYTRTLLVGKSSGPLELLVAEDAPVTLLDPSRRAALKTRPGGVTWLTLPALESPLLLKLGVGNPAITMEAPEDPSALTHGGPARWPEPVVTRGRLGNEPGAYAVDTLTLPEPNRWNSWMRIGALDFFSDGRCAVCTLSGDVWVVSGIDASLQRLSWKRYATGLYEPLGLRIVHDVVHVLGRDRLTRLADLNHDGEADYYESFNSDLDVYPTYHAYAFDLQTDSAGNFYFVADGNMVDPFLPKHGSLLKVSADGARMEEFATGFRAANGMSVGPHDAITCSDNQGHWTPSSKISWVQRGGFYGYGGDPRQPRFPAYKKAKGFSRFEPPICWLPMSADNSSGGQVWVEGLRWGLPAGTLLHTSYGKCTLFEVLMEDVRGRKQGGVWQFPLKFDSGIMRGRFSPGDGQLYVAGLKGWQTSAAHDGALQRVRFTGRPLHCPTALHVASHGLAITFDGPLDPASASDPANYAVAQWNYRWTSDYGSDSWSVVDPAKKGQDPVEVTAATLSPDARTVVLTTQPLRPVMQMRLKYSIKTADGAALTQEIDNTIHSLP